MIKTGLVGNFTTSELSAITSHPDLLITGYLFAGDTETSLFDISKFNIPELPEEELLGRNKAFIFGHSSLDLTGLIAEALKRSMHLLFLDREHLISGEIRELIKLHDEAQTVLHARQAEKSIPVLEACQSMIFHPCIIDIKLVTLGTFNKSLLLMLEALLSLCPINIRKVHATRQNPEMPVSTSPLSARIEFDNGSVANMTYSAIAHDEFFSIEIYQKLNRLEINVLENKLKIFKNSIPGNIINCDNIEFPYNENAVIKNELDNFREAILNKNTTGKVLFDVFRLTEISRKIVSKTGFP
jgi:hypothetical protein